jgi:hypothetical protein
MYLQLLGFPKTKLVSYFIFSTLLHPRPGILWAFAALPLPPIFPDADNIIATYLPTSLSTEPKDSPVSTCTPWHSLNSANYSQIPSLAFLFPAAQSWSVFPSSNTTPSLEDESYKAGRGVNSHLNPQHPTQYLGTFHFHPYLLSSPSTDNLLTTQAAHYSWTPLGTMWSPCCPPGCPNLWNTITSLSPFSSCMPWKVQINILHLAQKERPTCSFICMCTEHWTQWFLCFLGCHLHWIHALV